MLSLTQPLGSIKQAQSCVRYRSATKQRRLQIWPPPQMVEPAGRHWLFRHTDVVRSQHTPPQRVLPRLQQMLLVMHSSSGPHTRPPHVVEPAIGAFGRQARMVVGVMMADHT